MRDRQSDLEARGARVVVVGMGATETARRFRAQRRLPFVLLVDKKRISYRLLGLGRGSASDVMGPKVWKDGLKSLVRHGQGLPTEDPYQLGGVAIVDNAGNVKLVHRSKTSADNLPVDELLDAI